MRIGLLSDTHGYLDPSIFIHFDSVDEIWHAGDIGNLTILDELESFKPVRMVYGNIDDQTIRARLPEDLFFQCEKMKVWMTHIGGRPGKYPLRIRETLLSRKPEIFICGHSHILKVIFDHKYGVLYMNPGACGFQGIHKIRTVIRFTIQENIVKDAEIIELGDRSKGSSP